MKKLLVVLSVLFVVALIAGPAFAVNMYDPEARAAKLAEVKASPLRVSGEFTFGAITPFDAATANSGFYNMYVDFTLYVDDYNSVLFEVAGNKTFTPGTFTVPYFELTTDVGKALDLPIGLKNTAGLTSLYSRKYEVTGLAYERAATRPFIDPLAWKFAIDAMGKATITAGLGFGQGGDLFNDIGVIVEIPAIGPASAEAYYLSNNNADFKGILGFDVKATGLLNEMLSVAGGFFYDMVEVAAENPWFWGVGASVKYSKLTAGLSANGNNVDAFNVLGIDADYALTDVFGLQAGVGLAFADGAETFQGADIGAYAKIGAAKWSIGYVIADATGFAYVPAVAGIDGGLYLNADINF